MKYLKSTKKTLLTVVCITYVLLTLLYALEYLNFPNFLIKTDVVSFLTGAKIIKEGKTDLLYDLATQSQYQNEIVAPFVKILLPFRNFPITAFFYILLLDMGLLHAYSTIFLFGLIFLVAFHFIFTHFFPDLKKYKLLILLPLFFYPSVSNLIIGQYTPLILLIFLSIYLALVKDKSFWSGFATSFLSIKPQYLLFAPFSLALSINRKKYVFGFFSGLILFFLLNLAVTKNLIPFINYPGFLFSTENSTFGSRPYQMLTLFGIVKRFLPQLNSLHLIIGNMAFYCLTVVLILKKYRKENDTNKLFILGIFAALLFSVHALSHDLMILLLPIYIYLTSSKNNATAFITLIGIVTGMLFFFQSNLLIVIEMIVFVILILNDKHSYAPEHHKRNLN